MLNAERVRFNQIVTRAAEAVPVAVKNRVVRYFPDTFLGNGHRGLTELAKKANIDVRKLDLGEFVIFVNKKQTALKMFVQGNIVAHLKMPGTQRIDLRTITMIPRFFNGTEINYTAALKEVFKKNRLQ